MAVKSISLEKCCDDTVTWVQPDQPRWEKDLTVTEVVDHKLQLDEPMEEVSGNGSALDELRDELFWNMYLSCHILLSLGTSKVATKNTFLSCQTLLSAPSSLSSGLSRSVSAPHLASLPDQADEESETYLKSYLKFGAALGDAFVVAHLEERYVDAACAWCVENGVVLLDKLSAENVFPVFAKDIGLRKLEAKRLLKAIGGATAAPKATMEAPTATHVAPNATAFAPKATTVAPKAMTAASKAAAAAPKATTVAPKATTEAPVGGDVAAASSSQRKGSRWADMEDMERTSPVDSN